MSFTPIKCVLTNLSQNDHTRTNEIEGECFEEPTVGKPFKMVAPPLANGDVRIVVTSPVVRRLMLNGGIFFHTENTLYTWREIL